jgi:hypothetical protein
VAENGGTVVLTKSELIALLQKEVRLLLHLTAKIEPAALDYRPTPKQRSTIELLRYLTNAGPALIAFATGEPMDAAALAEATAAANARNFEETVAALAAHSDLYARLLGDMTDEDLRVELTWVDGKPMSRGLFLVNYVFGQLTAYRLQLFLYLKACGREELNTMNLWLGADVPAPA